ncbi:hypothetical protein ACVWZW_006306 [Bradyrhizobium sp. F1.13.4]
MYPMHRGGNMMGAALRREVQQRIQLSSPGLTGRSSIPERAMVNREAAAYWMPRSSRCMTAEFGATRRLPAIMPFCPCFARRSNNYFAFPEVKKKHQ